MLLPAIFLTSVFQEPLKIDLQGQGQSVVLLLSRGNERNSFRYLPSALPTQVAFRHGDKWAVYDERGLSVRVGQRVRTFRLEDYPLSPKLWEKNQIIENKQKIESKTYSLRPNALMGSVQEGSKTWWILQWHSLGSEKAVWLEVLLVVDLSQSDPRPELVGRLPLLTSRVGGLRIEQKLFRAGDGLSVVGVLDDNRWGVGLFSLSSRTWSTKSLSNEPPYDFTVSGRRMYYLSGHRAPYRLFVADLATGDFRELRSVPGAQPSVLSADSQVFLTYRHSTGSGDLELTLVNLRTGSEVSLRAQSPVVRVGSLGVAIFDGVASKAPSKVYLYQPDPLVRTHEIPLN
jgi:hypothetical protein